ncbi:MAG: lysophospholipid acyltransferase family protein [Syntrophothermus sp.]
MRKRFEDLLLRGLVATLVFVFNLLPERAGLWCAERFAGGVYRLVRSTKHKDFVPGNIRVAFPEYDDAAIEEIALGHLRLLVKSIVEIIRLPRLNRHNLGRKVTVTGLEHLEKAKELGKGAIILTAHFGNWELLMAAMAIKGHPGVALAQQQSKAAFDRFLLSRRSLFGNGVLYNDSGGTQKIFKLLRQNGMLYLVADQHGESLKAIVPFFGQMVSAQAGPVAFGMKTGAPVIPAFIVREKGDRHRIIIEKPLELSNTGRKEADLTENCARMMAVFERYIRAYPDHWLWVHNRWDKLPRALKRQREGQAVTEAATASMEPAATATEETLSRN